MLYFKSLSKYKLAKGWFISRQHQNIELPVWGKCFSPL